MGSAKSKRDTNNTNVAQHNSNDNKTLEPGEHEYVEAHKCRTRRQHTTALELFLKAAALDYPSAFVMLYSIYRGNWGVPKDSIKVEMYATKVKENIDWLLQKSTIGDADHQYNLGYIYVNGVGIEENKIEAARLYCLSSNQGYPAGQNALGMFYYHGIVVRQNIEEAVQLWHEAALAGDSDAQFNLGDCYYKGVGVEKDVMEGISYYELSSIQGNVMSQYALGLCYQHGYGVKKDIHEAVRRLTLASNLGFASAQNNLGTVVLVSYLR